LDQPRTTPSRKTRLQREIEVTDRQIDQLVYELCGLEVRASLEAAGQLVEKLRQGMPG